MRDTIDEDKLDVLKDSLCNPGTKWIEINKSSKKVVLCMELLPEQKIWYQIIKHSLKPMAPYKTINKDRLVFLHFITTFSAINVAKFIVPKMQA